MDEVIDPRLIPEVNIGMLGHVAHGKSTLTLAITGKLTLQHSEELKRGITIRLGYADATIYKCPKCGKYSTSPKCPYCFADTEPQRTISIVDAPGHETLMATVLTGTGIMDGAILVIAANEPCPRPQTLEHLKALEIVGIKNIVIVQNKIDLVTKEQALKNYREIKEFVKGTIAENAPIIPISAQQKVNIDKVLEAIQTHIPTPKRDAKADPKMLVARSFDINKPGWTKEKLLGGILGGSIVQGEFKVGDEIEIKPGVKVNGKYMTLTTEIVGLQKAKKNLEKAGPGGLVGMATKLDPSLTKSDRLVGNIVSLPGKLPEPVWELRFEAHMLERVVGAEDVKAMPPIKQGEKLLINVATQRTLGIVNKIKGKEIEVDLRIPLVIEKGEKVVLSRRIAGRWRLVGYGIVL